MKTHTYYDRLCAGLKALGLKEDMVDRSKYTAFFGPKTGTKYFVGKSGALRVGRCASDSFSIGCPADLSNPRLVGVARYKQILELGDKALAKQPENVKDGAFDSF